jgi:hypothetical protein
MRVCMYMCMYVCMYVYKLCYQQIERQISLIHVCRRLLQRVSAICCSHLQGPRIYKENIFVYQCFLKMAVGNSRNTFEYSSTYVNKRNSLRNLLVIKHTYICSTEDV